MIFSSKIFTKGPTFWAPKMPKLQGTHLIVDEGQEARRGAAKRSFSRPGLGTVFLLVSSSLFSENIFISIKIEVHTKLVGPRLFFFR